VQLTANNEPEEQALYKEVCTQWTEARTPVQVCGSRSAGGGCYTDMQKIKACSAYSWARSPYDYRYYRRSAGTIWRYAPELAMTERLLVAVKEGDEVTVRELLPVVVNPNVTAGVGHESLLITALRGCQWSIAELLLSEGVDPTNVGSKAVKATVSGGTRKADREYCQDHRDGIVPTMRLLRSHGVDIKDGGEDALTTCALSGRYKEYVEAAKLLLDAGVDPNVKIEKTLSDGQSKLIEAPLSNAVPHTAMVKILLEAGANPNIEVGVTTPNGNSMITPLGETRRLCNDGNYRFDPQECAETIKLLTAAIGQ